MRTVLHILTRPDPATAQRIELQRLLPGINVEVVELSQETPPASYEQLLEKIFAADSIAVD